MICGETAAQGRLAAKCFLIGQGTLMIRCAQVILRRGHTICGVVTSDPAVRRWADEAGLARIGRITDLLTEPRRVFDYLFSIVNGEILTDQILRLPRRYAINYHDAVLPRYAGTHATSWALLNGETTHGITWHVMSGKVDGGDILKQRSFPVADGETACTLNAKCYEAAFQAFEELLEDIESGRLSLARQALEHRMYFAKHKRPEAGGVICWRRPAKEIDALVRGLQFGSYPNSLGVPKIGIDGRFVIVSNSAVVTDASLAAPGSITGLSADSMRVATDRGEIVVGNVFTIDGEPMMVPQFADLYGLREGFCFPDAAPGFLERSALCSEKLERHETFWVERLSDLRPAILPYAVRNPRGNRRATDTVSLRVRIPETFVENWRRTHPQSRTVHSVLAAYAVFLARMTETSTFDLAFRDHKIHGELDGLQELFAPFVPFRVDLPDSGNFADAVASIEAEARRISLRGTYPRDLLHRYPELRGVVSGNTLAVSVRAVPPGGSQIDQMDGRRSLSLTIPETGAACEWTFNADLVCPDLAREFSRKFVTFCENAARDFDQPLGAIPLLNAEDRDKIVTGWNRTERDYPRKRCIHELFEAQAAAAPDAIAVVYCGETITYRELNDRANQIARDLRSMGVQPETIVAICVARSIDMVAGLLGILKTGAAYLALDPRLPPERMSFMLADSHTGFAVTRRQDSTGLSPAGLRIVYTDDAPRASETANLCSGTTGENLAYVIYTSGSTGAPKGTLIPHRGAINWLTWMEETFQISNADRVLMKAPLTFDVSVWECFLPLITGGTAVLAEAGRDYDAPYLGRLLVTEEVTMAQFVPSVLSALLESEALADARKLRHVMCGGEVMSANLQRRFFAQCSASLCNSYGPTEASIGITMWACQPEDIRETVPIGTSDRE